MPGGGGLPRGVLVVGCGASSSCAGSGAASDMWCDAASGMIPGAGSTFTNVIFPNADGTSIVIN